MKKTAVIVSCALLGFACVFARENRAAGQGKVAGAQAQAKKVPTAEAPLPQIDKEKIRAHVKYLSSDELEGRGTGQRGGDMAADYIGKQFASYGLKPAGDNGTFFQDVPMVGVKTLPETTFKFAEASGKSFEARNLIDFVTNNESGHRCPHRVCGLWNQGARVRLGRLQERRPSRESGVALRERAQRG